MVLFISLQALRGQLRAPHTDSSAAITAHALTMRYFCCANMSVESSGAPDFRSEIFMCTYWIFFLFSGGKTDANEKQKGKERGRQNKIRDKRESKKMNKNV